MILDIYEKCNDNDKCIGRWERWEPHRQNINKALFENILKRDKLQNALILGAGRCDVMDLKFLLDNIKHITLVDYDYKSMEDAIERQGLTADEKQRITLKGQIEFTGFYNGDNIDIITKAMEKNEEEKKLVSDIINYIENINHDLCSLLGDEKYQLVISGAVHSQLIVPFLELAKADKKYMDEILRYIGHIANIFAEKLNENLLRLVQDEHYLLSYFDVMEMSDRNNTMIFCSLLNGLLLQGEYGKIEELLSRNSGVAGARHGCNHLKQLAGQENYSENAWIWNYRDDKKYYVKCVSVKKTVDHN